MSDSTQNFVEKPEEASKSSSSNLRQRFPSKDFNPSFQCPLDSDEKDDEEVKPSILAAQEHKNKLRSLRIRTLSTLALFFLLILFVYLGHVFLVALLFFIQFVMVGELFKMARIAQKEKTLPGFRAQQWYFFFVATVYMYGRFVKKNLWSEITTDRRLMKVFGGLLRKHNLVSFSLYVAGFIMFVLSLRKRMYLYQFGQYAWTHMILLTVFMPSSFFVSNIFEGIIWLLLPCSLIFTNDIAAYLAGFFFGRTPLIKLSPKKTWEGFVGGLIGTVAAAILLSSVMGRFKWLTCPRTDLSIGYLSCPDDPLYQPRVFTLRDLDPWVPDVVIEHLADLARQPWAPQWLIGSVMSVEITAQPIQIHACFLAVFASLIGPFGGFFASGFKRAFKVKDFGHSIPGHGGMTDRMDCQILMAMFSYLWYHNIIRTAEATVSDVMDMVTSMGRADQLELINRLLEFASSEGLLQGQA